MAIIREGPEPARYGHLSVADAVTFPTIRPAVLAAHRALQRPVRCCGHLAAHRGRRWRVCFCPEPVLRCTRCSSWHQDHTHGHTPAGCAGCGTDTLSTVDVWFTLPRLVAVDAGREWRPGRVTLVGAGRLCDACRFPMAERMAS